MRGLILEGELDSARLRARRQREKRRNESRGEQLRVELHRYLPCSSVFGGFHERRWLATLMDIASQRIAPETPHLHYVSDWVIEAVNARRYEKNTTNVQDACLVRGFRVQ